MLAVPDAQYVEWLQTLCSGSDSDAKFAVDLSFLKEVSQKNFVFQLVR